MSPTVAIGQLEIPVDLDVTHARQQAVTAALGAFRAGADIVVLPELSVPGYTTDRVVLSRVAEPVPGPTTDALVDVAREGRGLVVAGLAEFADGSIFNSAVAITGDGVIAVYRKLHPFAQEKHVFAPGDRGLPVVDTPFGRIGLCICYDLRFPEVMRVLALRHAELICAPAAWVGGFDTQPSVLPGQVQGVIVQANLNQVFVACASQVGEPGSHRFLGCSAVVDPFGAVVAGPLSGDDPATALAKLDLDRVRDAQHRSSLITPRADRRTDVYGISYGNERL